MGLMDNDVDMQSVENRFKQRGTKMAFEKRQMIRKVIETRTYFELFSTTDQDAYIQKGIDEGRTNVVRYAVGGPNIVVVDVPRLLTESEIALFLAQSGE